MSAFACIGDACEDNCCHTWRIPYTQDDYQRLRHMMGGSEAERATFAAAVKVTDPPHPRRYASLCQVGSMCTFLTPQRMCGLQQRYGAGALSEICASYPRTANPRGDLSEVWGVLSCPEVARRSLLATDAMDVVEAPEELLASLQLDAEAPGAGLPPAFAAQLTLLRPLVLRLLSRREFPLAERLTALATACHRSLAFLHADTPATNAVALHELFAAADAALAAPATARAGAEQAGASFPAPLADALSLVLAGSRGSSLRQLTEAVLLACGEDPASSDGPAFHPRMKTFWDDHRRRAQHWNADIGPYLALPFENFARHHWLTGWQVDSRSLWDHVAALLYRFALLRFLVLAHPLLEGSRAAGYAGRRQAFQRAAVDTAYKLVRELDHGERTAELQARTRSSVDSLTCALAVAQV
jgi:lysine-N-methylase